MLHSHGCSRERGNNMLRLRHTGIPHLAVAVPGVAVVPRQTRVAVPAARVAQTRETLASSNDK